MPYWPVPTVRYLYSHTRSVEKSLYRRYSVLLDNTTNLKRVVVVVVVVVAIRCFRRCVVVAARPRGHGRTKQRSGGLLKARGGTGIRARRWRCQRGDAGGGGEDDMTIEGPCMPCVGCTTFEFERKPVTTLPGAAMNNSFKT